MKIYLPSLSVNEGVARSAVAVFVAQLNPTIEEISDIKCAVSEAVTNAIVHAYPDSVGRISMRLRILEGDMLEISIRDWGRGIENVEQAMEPLYTTGGEERSGMGFTIMGSFTDKLKVRSVSGKGTTVTMQKYICPRYRHR
jgi:stage II sporulation protein AB (anti-sigma F factor)